MKRLVWLVVAMKLTGEYLRGDAVLGVSEGTEARGGVVTENTVSIGSDPVLSGTVLRFVDSDCNS